MGVLPRYLCGSFILKTEQEGNLYAVGLRQWGDGGESHFLQGYGVISKLLKCGAYPLF